MHSTISGCKSVNQQLQITKGLDESLFSSNTSRNLFIICIVFLFLMSRTQAKKWGNHHLLEMDVSRKNVNAQVQPVGYRSFLLLHQVIHHRMSVLSSILNIYLFIYSVLADAKSDIIFRNLANYFNFTVSICVIAEPWSLYHWKRV